MAFVIVQHLSPRHESLLRALLAGFTRMPVIEVSDGDVIKLGSVNVKFREWTDGASRTKRIRGAARK